MSISHRESEAERTIKSRRGERANGLWSSWMDRWPSVQQTCRKKERNWESSSRVLSEVQGDQDSTLILGGDFNVSLVGLTDSWRVNPKAENADGHKRFTASESFTHTGDRTGSDGGEHVDERRLRTRVVHTFKLVRS